MKIEVRYSWRTKWGGRVTTSRIKMTEEQARRGDPNAIRVDNSREEKIIYDQAAEMIYHGAPAGFGGPRGRWQSILTYPCDVPGREGRVPLRGPAELYSVSCDGDVWTVVQATGGPPLLMYQGVGPVTVSPAPS